MASSICCAHALVMQNVAHTAAHARQLCDVLAHHRLRHLTLIDEGFRAETVERIQWSSLTDLVSYHGPVSDAILTAIAASCPNLTELNAAAHLGHGGMSTLLHSLGAQLVSLHLSVSPESAGAYVDHLCRLIRRNIRRIRSTWRWRRP